MINRTYISILLGLALVIWSIAAAINGTNIAWELVGHYGWAVSSVTAICIGFDKYMWHWKVFRDWLVQQPNLNGTWKAKLRSSYKDIHGKSIEKVAYLVVDQTFSKLRVRMYTDESRSHSIAQNISRTENNLFQLAIAYINTPTAELRGDRSQMHLGSVLLSHIDYESECVEGDYWTDRQTFGEIKLLERRQEKITTFGAGSTLFN